MVTKNEFKEIFTNAIMKNPELFHLFNKPQRRFSGPGVEEFLKNGLFEICKECVKYDMLKHVLKADGLLLEIIGKLDIDQNDELCKIAVEQNGRALQYVKNQTPDLIKIATSSDYIMIFDLKMSDIVELE
jgi:hypothetical protein